MSMEIPSLRELKTNPKAFFRTCIQNKLNYSGTIPDRNDGNKTISNNYEKAKTFKGTSTDT